MDGRLLRACQLLMEFAAAQLDEIQRTPEDELLTTDNEQLNNKRRAAEEPRTDYGDNPHFDPARFTEMRRGQAEAAVAYERSAPEPVVYPFEDTVPEPVPVYAEPTRLPFAAPPSEERTVNSGKWTVETPDARRADPAADPVGTANIPPAQRRENTQPGGPTAKLIMRDISDHFERDARRY